MSSTITIPRTLVLPFDFYSLYQKAININIITKEWWFKLYTM